LTDCIDVLHVLVTGFRICLQFVSDSKFCCRLKIRSQRMRQQMPRIAGRGSNSVSMR